MNFKLLFYYLHKINYLYEHNKYESVVIYYNNFNKIQKKRKNNKVVLITYSNKIIKINLLCKNFFMYIKRTFALRFEEYA